MLAYGCDKIFTDTVTGKLAGLTSSRGKRADRSSNAPAVTLARARPSASMSLPE
jgi:hypothetical protein